jgi:hypothetical protein
VQSLRIGSLYSAAMNESLFEPSLQQVRTERPLYSTTTLFMSAFFGGALAGVIVFAVNAWRGSRLARDGAWIGLAAAFALSLPFLVLAVLPEVGSGTGRILMRGLALLLAGALYLRHRHLFRAQDLFAASRPNGWPLGLAAIAIAFVVGLLSIEAAQNLLGSTGEGA